MTSAAAIEGIQANGLRWQHRFSLQPFSRQLGDINNAGGAEREVIEPIVEAIVAKVRKFAERLDEDIRMDLEARADELEMVSDCDIDEVNHFMGELYDSFDYWRILVN